MTWNRRPLNCTRIRSLVLQVFSELSVLLRAWCTMLFLTLLWTVLSWQIWRRLILQNLICRFTFLMLFIGLRFCHRRYCLLKMKSMSTSAGPFLKSWRMPNLMPWKRLLIRNGLMVLSLGRRRKLQTRRFLFPLPRKILSWFWICRAHLLTTFARTQAIAVCSCVYLLLKLRMPIVSTVRL